MRRMTNEEAIEVLDAMKVKVEIPKAAVTQYKRNVSLDMAIEALSKTKRGLSEDDLISRQAAIDAIHNYWKKRLDTLPTKMTECGEVDTVIQSIDKIFEHNKTLESLIKALPSAQPEPTFEQIEEYCHKRCLSIVDNALLHKYVQAEIQPEIIRCKDCKYGGYNPATPNKHRPGDAAFPAHWRCYYYKKFIPIVTQDGFCNKAERRTDE